MNPEDQSHRFVITGQDPEGHSRTICECVVAVLLGGSAPGSVLATRCDSRTIWPLGRALSDDLSAVVAGTGLAHQVGLIRSLSAMA
jgi:hypothetical protein